jgi:hypothetical protein
VLGDPLDQADRIVEVLGPALIETVQIGHQHLAGSQVAQIGLVEDL